MAEVKKPPFTHGKKQQLKIIDVDWSRERTTVIIHVEKDVDVVKPKYTIHRLLISFLCEMVKGSSTIHKIVRVWCS